MLKTLHKPQFLSHLRTLPSLLHLRPQSTSAPSSTPPDPPLTAPRTALTTALTSTLQASTASSSAPDAIDADEISRLQMRFSQGDVYAPHDLSHAFQRSRRLRRSPAYDAADVAGVDFRAEYKNFFLLSEYVSEMGRIKHRSETGLRGVNQRRMARAVRRAIGLGFMPMNHRHPEYILSKRRRGGGLGGI